MAIEESKRGDGYSVVSQLLPWYAFVSIKVYKRTASLNSWRVKKSLDEKHFCPFPYSNVYKGMIIHHY